ncbi:hypothetical protein CEE37_11400 [candidate division LCP-89 bacterium B3_LCP]|uniref:Glycosyl transferase family 1 domain-containing protein n=1 Tax=candidate division LCP-89 bacterium B3_LCP TaxID=2012998 RepID=A0A532UVQ7_UNCL8|nr:MAG: hypothetical protein CEE37_11400 [candidate division LCP-89 bacterium B3_LCP]
MKLLLIDPTLPHPGEAAKIRAFAGIGDIDLTVLTGNVQRDGTREVRIEQSNIEDVNLHIGRVTGKFPNRTIFLTELVKCLQKRPDVILAYSDTDHLLTLQIALTKGIITPKSKLIVQAWENQQKSMKSHPQANVLLYVLDSFLEKTVITIADGIAARNPEAREILTNRNLNIPVKVIPWAVDTDLFQEREEKSSEKFTVVYVGRLDRAKGIMDILKAVKDLHDVRVIIIGEGPYRKQLEGFAVDNRLDCTFTGSVDQPKLPDVLRGTDLFILPSRTTGRWAEQFGRAAVEAMAMDIPVIGSDSGSIPWVIGDPELIFKEGDISELREKICRFVADHSYYQAKSQYCLKRAREEFNWIRHAQTAVDFCREIA